MGIHLKMKGLTLTVVIFICAAGCSLIKAAPEEGVGKLPDKVVIAEDATEEQVENEKEESDGRSPSKRRSSDNCNISANKQIMDKLNNERARRGLGPLACDPNLVYVAWAHTQSQNDHYGSRSRIPAGCNLHSWNGHPKGKDCCYTGKHTPSDFACMHPKPSEVLGGNRPNAYEISHAIPPAITSTSAVRDWMKSSGHADVVLTKGIWHDLTKIGCWHVGEFANCWFW